MTDSVVNGFEPGHRFTFTYAAGPIPVSGEDLVVSTPDGSGHTDLTSTLCAELRGL